MAETKTYTFDDREQAHNELKELLEGSVLPELADKLHELPNDRVEALYAMIAEMKLNNVQRAVYRYQVLQDILNILSGTNVKHFSDDFLTCKKHFIK